MLRYTPQKLIQKLSCSALEASLVVMLLMLLVQLLVVLMDVDIHIRVSINGGTPKWMVYKGKSH